MNDHNLQFNIAESQMTLRFRSGEDQERALLEQIGKTVIVDRLVPPSATHFFFNEKETTVQIAYGFGTQAQTAYKIHPHALNQLCSKVSLPMAYANMLQVGDSWKKELFVHNLNELFHQPAWIDRDGSPTRFLHRLVGNELRGFLSRRYNRHLASAPLLRAFTDQCRSEGARPIEALNTPVRSALKTLLPTVFEAFPGEYICLGVEWSNSDFGSGKLKVMQTVWRVGSGTSAVLDEGMAKAHIGSIIQDSDLEVSDETAQKEVAAQQSAVRDHVRQYLSEKTIDRMLTAIRSARDQQIPWGSLRTRLKDILGKGDLDWLQSVLDQKGSSIIDLPPISFTADGAPVPNAYWASSAVSFFAAKTEDQDRKLDLQREAGKLLAAALAAA